MSALFTFNSPMETTETCKIIKDVIASIGGKLKFERGNIIEATWRSPKFKTLFPSRFAFYVGANMVRVTMSTGVWREIMYERGRGGADEIWHKFVEELLSQHPSIDFGLSLDRVVMEYVKFFGDGTEQVFTSHSRSKPSLGGAIVGGLLFGSTGAILGGMNTRTVTSGRTITRFSNTILATCRYTNGLVLNGEITVHSPFYNEIMANMSQLTE